MTEINTLFGLVWHGKNYDRKTGSELFSRSLYIRPDDAQYVYDFHQNNTKQINIRIVTLSTWAFMLSVVNLGIL